MITIKPYQFKLLSIEYDTNLAKHIMQDAYARGIIPAQSYLMLDQIKKQIIKSHEHGFRTEYAKAIYVFSSLCFGDDFDTDTHYKFHTVFNNQELSPDVKAKMIDQLAQEESS